MKTKIIIAGIGGVGGYFGGLLAREFYNNDKVEINFLARGKNLEIIKDQGLTIIKGTESFITKPNVITDNPADFGKADLIVLSVKSYDVEEILSQLNDCITNKTVFLPLLNGVDSRKKIQEKFPNNLVLNGCVYIVSRLTEPGKIENFGNIEKLYFGDESIQNENLVGFEKIFLKAKIDAVLSKDIEKIVWEKFIFISAIATSTSFFNKTVGEIFENSEMENQLRSLINEVTELAKMKQIKLSEDIEELTFSKLKTLPYTATSSMHSDFINKKSKTELESLTGYVISESEKYGLKAPVFEKMYQNLINK